MSGTGVSVARHVTFVRDHDVSVPVSGAVAATLAVSAHVKKPKSKIPCRCFTVFPDARRTFHQRTTSMFCGFSPAAKLARLESTSLLQPASISSSSLGLPTAATAPLQHVAIVSRSSVAPVQTPVRTRSAAADPSRRTPHQTATSNHCSSSAEARQLAAARGGGWRRRNCTGLCKAAEGSLYTVKRFGNEHGATRT
jgi:hypothetical protein